MSNPKPIATLEGKTVPVAEKSATIVDLQSVSELTSQLPQNKGTITATPPKESFIAFTLRTLNELRFVKFALASFVINNLRRRYQRSVLGFAWSLLNPLLMMIVLTTVFSLIFKRDPKTFGIFILTGMLPWTFISESIANGCSSITSAEQFLKKVYIPKIFFPLVTVSTELINFALSLVSMLALALFLGLHLHRVILFLPLAMGVTYLFSFGLALALAVATVYFRDIAHFVRVILSCFFYLIPILYPLDRVPQEYQLFFQINPFTHFITLFRNIIYDGIAPTAQEWLIPIGLTILSLIIGFFMLKQKEKDIIFRL
jgi:ABC-type polysaccharide/polyol phosphate export permease